MVASDVGTRGAKNKESCPAIIEVFAQSKRTIPVRKRSTPITAPFVVSGNPPPKSNFTFALVCAPATSGPNASIPICDCRNDPANAPDVSGVSGGVAISGKSKLSTDPRVTVVFSSTIPDKRTRYFDPLSTLVWL